MPEYLTVEELADLIRTKPESIYAMRADGRAPHATRPAGRLLFARADVIAWLDAGRDLAS